MMPLKIKNRLLCWDPYILQYVIYGMPLEITNRLVGKYQAIYHGKPDVPARA